MHIPTPPPLTNQPALGSVQKGSRKNKTKISCVDPQAFLSFGAGVQSTALWLLIKNEPDRVLRAMGRLPKLAIFADTGAEPTEVYQHISSLEEMGGLEIKRVSKAGPSLAEVVEQNIGTRFPIPAFTKNPDGKAGMLRRKCTSEYKIKPIQGTIRNLLGYLPRQRIPANSAESWIGISTDEAGRVSESGVAWIRNRYPLLEMGLSRDDCREIIRLSGLVPVKSRCYFCPYIGDWAAFKAIHPEAFEKAVRADAAIRDRSKAGVKNPVYLARSLKPLEEHVRGLKGAPEEVWEDQGFEDECRGICGI